jgi:RNA polymerase sigma factor (sigma-70 family)
LEHVSNEELVARVQAGSKEAAEQLLTQNQGLIHSQIKHYLSRCGAGVEPDDLLQEARLAVWRAALGFDPERGVAFSTYVVHGISRGIERCLGQNGRTIKLSLHAIRAARDGRQHAPLPRVACSLDARQGDEEGAPRLCDLIPAVGDLEDQVVERLTLEDALATLTPDERSLVWHRIGTGFDARLEAPLVANAHKLLGSHTVGPRRLEDISRA